MNAKMRKFSIVWVLVNALCCVKMTDLHIQVFQLQVMYQKIMPSVTAMGDFFFSNFIFWFMTEMVFYGL